MLTASRLTYRINRFEIRAILAATILSTVVTAAILTWMTSSGYAACVINFTDTPSVACLNLMDIGAWANRIVGLSLNLVPLFPFLAGVLLGTPVIARELDRGTARLAWSLGPSRLRWFVERVVLMLVLTLLACFAIGVVADWIVALYAPGVDLANSFAQYHQRGILIATGGFLVASVAIGLGAVVGRTMPTLILALVLSGASVLAITEVSAKLLVNEAVPLEQSEGGNNDLQLDSRFQLPDGRLVTWDELTVIDPESMNAEFGPQYPYVALGIPGSRHREIEAREAVAEVVVGLAFLGLGAFVVGRRRPG
ncbi:MAG: hypothetical protein ABI553_10240 [Chloroflexota bacterium]